MVLPPGVARACVALFGNQPDLSRLTQSQLKKTFQQRVMHVHPDRAQALGDNPEVLTQRFQLLQHAFETLSHFLHYGKPPRGDYWSGGLPARELRLGEFLYFTGYLPWSTVGAGLSAQRQRPSWGTTAVALGLLRKVEVEQLELRRLARERIGEAAVRLGKLSTQARDRVLAEQQRRTPPLGECLLELGSILPHELEHILAGQRAHNGAWARWAA